MNILVTCPPMINMIKNYDTLFKKFNLNYFCPKFSQTLTVEELVNLENKEFETKIKNKFKNSIDERIKLLTDLSNLLYITGGGIVENLPRILSKDLTAKIQLDSWNVPFSLKWAIKRARLSQNQALQTFNCGIGFIAIVPTNKSREFEIQSKKINEPVVKIGEIIQGNQLEFKGYLNID